MKLSKAQKNILSVIIEATIKTRGKNKGQQKDVISSDSFDGRSFYPLLDKGLVTYQDGVFGSGYVATENALHLNLKSK